MASELRVNTLKDASGNNSVAMQYVAEGTAKVWANVGQIIFSVHDSLNISSAVDSATGNITHNISSAMGNNRYAVVGYYTPANNNSGSDNFSINMTTTAYETRHFENGTQYDVNYRGSTIQGDLA